MIMEMITIKKHEKTPSFPKEIQQKSSCEFWARK
jgi:hypothetical protein